MMGILFALMGVGELAIALDVRWSAVRIALQSQMIGIATIVLAMVFSWSILFLPVASPLLYIWMETRGKVIERAVY